MANPADVTGADLFGTCPVPRSRYDEILLGHGSGGQLTADRTRRLFLAAAFILEEGLPLDDLRRIVASMRAACAEAGVALVTGDTKVVDRGKGDQVFVTTSGGGLGRGGRAGRGGPAAPARGAGGLRDARPGPALRRQRGEALGRRPARGR